MLNYFTILILIRKLSRVLNLEAIVALYPMLLHLLIKLLIFELVLNNSLQFIPIFISE
mgnify:CR=1 FL=1